MDNRRSHVKQWPPKAVPLGSNDVCCQGDSAAPSTVTASTLSWWPFPWEQCNITGSEMQSTQLNLCAGGECAPLGLRGARYLADDRHLRQRANSATRKVWSEGRSARRAWTSTQAAVDFSASTFVAQMWSTRQPSPRSTASRTR